MAGSRQYTPEEIIEAIQQGKGSQTQAAKLLGVSLRTLQYYVAKVPGVKEAYRAERFKLVDNSERTLAAYASGFVIDPVLDKDGEFRLKPDGTVMTKRRRVRDSDQLRALENIMKYYGKEFGLTPAYEVQGSADKPIEVKSSVNIQALSTSEKKELLNLLEKVGVTGQEQSSGKD